jgi:hypothetical protein
METKHVRNKLTTDEQLVDMAASLWCAAADIRRTLIKTNVASYYREVNLRIVTRLEKQATKLGRYLTKPNPEAFESYHSTKQFADKLNIVM